MDSLLILLCVGHDHESRVRLLEMGARVEPSGNLNVAVHGYLSLVRLTGVDFDCVEGLYVVEVLEGVGRCDGVVVDIDQLGVAVGVDGQGVLVSDIETEELLSRNWMMMELNGAFFLVGVELGATGDDAEANPFVVVLIVDHVILQRYLGVTPANNCDMFYYNIFLLLCNREAPLRGLQEQTGSLELYRKCLSIGLLKDVHVGTFVEDLRESDHLNLDKGLVAANDPHGVEVIDVFPVGVRRR